LNVLINQKNILIALIISEKHVFVVLVFKPCLFELNFKFAIKWVSFINWGAFPNFYLLLKIALKIRTNAESGVKKIFFLFFN